MTEETQPNISKAQPIDWPGMRIGQALDVAAQPSKPKPAFHRGFNTAKFSDLN